MMAGGIRNSSSSTMLGMGAGRIGDSSNSRKAAQPGTSNQDLD